MISYYALSIFLLSTSGLLYLLKTAGVGSRPPGLPPGPPTLPVLGNLHLVRQSPPYSLDIANV